MVVVEGVEARETDRQASLRLRLAEEYANSRGKGGPRIFISYQVSTQLWKGQQVVGVAHRQSDDAPPRLREALH